MQEFLRCVKRSQKLSLDEQSQSLFFAGVDGFAQRIARAAKMIAR